MKLKKINFLVVFLLLGLALRTADASFFFAAASAGGGESYLINEGFEGTGIPANFTALETSGSPDFNFDDTSSPLVDAQSFSAVDTTSGHEKVWVDFGARDEVWIALTWIGSDVTAGGGNAYPWGLADATGVEQNYLVMENSPNVIRIHTDAGFSVSAEKSVSASTRYWMKIRAKKGTGNNAEMEFWLTSNYAAGWGTSATSTDGDTTTQLRYLIFDSYNTYDIALKEDNLLIKATDIAITELTAP